MSHKIVTITQPGAQGLSFALLRRIQDEHRHLAWKPKVYGVPRGGIPVALGLGVIDVQLVDDPRAADCFVDDIVDSGATREKFLGKFPGKKFYALIDKTDQECPEDLKKAWIVFPWEGTEAGSSEDIFLRLLQYIGEDPKRGGLVDTPRRMAKAWREWTDGYGKNPADVLRTFSDGAQAYDEAISIPQIPFYSHCEHHLAPFFGEVVVSYIPSGKIVGLSKLVRVVDIFAHRLQVQERLTTDICDALSEALAPKGVGVSIKARHLCMESRGVARQGQYTVTTALRGVMLSDEKARAEFLQRT